VTPTKRRPPLDFDAVRAIGLALPDTEESTAYGSPALKVRGRMYACVPINRQAEPNSLAVIVDMTMRDDLITEDPDTYYVKPHYADYPCVLVRLDHIHRDALRDLLAAAHRRASAARPRARRPVRRRRVAT
jgi:hypothetical protein